MTYVPSTAPFDMMQFSEASTIEGTEFKLDWYNTGTTAQVAWIEIDYTGIIFNSHAVGVKIWSQKSDFTLNLRLRGEPNNLDKNFL